MFESLMQDMRFGLRIMRKAPGVTAVTLAALALGIGATSSIFSLVYGVMLRPLPYRESSRIVKLEQVFPAGRAARTTVPRYLFWREHQTTLESVATFMGGTHVNLESGDQPARILVRPVTADFFHVLGVAPAAGRFFFNEEDRPAAAPVAVLGNGLWKNSFGGEANVIGRAIALGEKTYTIIGIAPQGMDSTLTADAFVPLEAATAPMRGGTNFSVIGRIREGVSLAQADANMRVVASQFRASNPGAMPAVETAGAFSFQSEISRDVRPMLLLLFAAVGVVLLIACVNVANLMLARAATRQREIALRIALGASASRVLRQLLAESVTLALVGSALGLALTKLAIWAVVTLKPIDLPRLGEVALDWRVAIFAVALAVVTGIFFGLAPALRALHTDPRDALSDGGSRIGEGRSHRRFRDSLVVLEYGLSVVLLVGALLLTESFVRLNKVDPGFKTANALTVQVSLTGSRYATPGQVAAFDEQIAERVSRLPGVVAAATTNYLPLEGGFNVPIQSAEGHPFPPDRFPGNLEWFAITPDFVRAMGMRLNAGREFNISDTASAPPVVIVNEAFARKYYPRENPLGKHIVIAWGGDSPREIVGVLADIHESDLTELPSPQTLVPVAQIGAPVSKLVNSIMPTTLVVRWQGAPGSLGGDVTAQIRAVDPLLPVFGVRTMNEVVGESIKLNRFLLWLIGGFAIAAVALAAIGIYGVMSYLVTQRTREMGIRAALGAQPGSIVRMILGEAALRAAVGLLLGLAGAFALTKLLQAYLFGVTPQDPAAFSLAPTILILVALIATWLPARRAASVAPMAALRHE